MFTIDGHLDLSAFLVIMNKAAMNIGCKSSVLDISSLRCDVKPALFYLIS